MSPILHSLSEVFFHIHVTFGVYKNCSKKLAFLFCSFSLSHCLLFSGFGPWELFSSLLDPPALPSWCLLSQITILLSCLSHVVMYLCCVCLDGDCLSFIKDTCPTPHFLHLQPVLRCCLGCFSSLVCRRESSLLSLMLWLWCLPSSASGPNIRGPKTFFLWGLFLPKRHPANAGGSGR